MEDLDSLLEDLGRGKSTSSTKKNRPPSSRVDLNELENLMEDLGAAPTPKPTPAPAPVSYNATVNSTFTPPAAASSARSSTASPPPAAAANMDDLDALMESLNASSSRNSRRVPAAATPSSNPASQKNAVAAAPKQTTSAVHNERPATNNFSQPQERRPDPMPERRPDPMPTRNTQPPPKAAPASRKGDALDDLLSNLNTQMNSIDTDNPASRGSCWTCRGAILGEVIQALGKTFHPEHFQCGNCRNPLGTSNFYEANGSPQCEDCYQQLFCPKCAHCDGPVLDRCITALGKKWHVDHFICTSCLKPFQGGNFFERDGRPYCEKDFYGLYAAKCAGCGEAIKGDCINALGSQWHPEHFSCSYCQKSFAGGSFFEYGGKPYCEIHYHQQTGSLCAGCGKAITGRCVNALEKKWHPEHFVCAFCMNPLAGGSFTEHNNKAYCKECHGKLWSNP